MPPRLHELLTLLDSLDDIELRSQFLIETAERFRSVPPDVATRPFDCEHRVPSCESEAYIWAQTEPDGRMKFYFAVENPQGISAKALAVILDETLAGEKAENIANVSSDIVYTIFGRGVSMGKGQGLMGMVNMVRALAGAAVGGSANG